MSILKQLPPILFLVVGTLSSAVHANDPARIVNLYDAFGASSALKKDWGFAALIEYGGKRVLFDTGNDAAVFAHNVKHLRVDLRKLDAVVISHRHGDHTSGLTYLLEINPDVKIYVPVEGAFFKTPLPQALLKRQPGLPVELQYYGGQPPERWVTGTPWEAGKFERVSKTTEILPGFYVLTTQSQKPGTLEMNEVSLAMKTPKGLAVVVGCSHPGVEKILSQAATIDAHLYTVVGGFHLAMTPEPEVRRVASEMHDKLHLQRVAPAHCTSELGFAVFRDRFRERFDHGGLGAVIPLP
ncbi:MAG: MBL fold metallo-hydrolase [Steroidobacter sp.]